MELEPIAGLARSAATERLPRDPWALARAAAREEPTQSFWAGARASSHRFYIRPPNETLQLSGVANDEVLVAAALAHTVRQQHLPGQQIARS